MSEAKSTISESSQKVDCAPLIHPTIRQSSPVETLGCLHSHHLRGDSFQKLRGRHVRLTGELVSLRKCFFRASAMFLVLFQVGIGGYIEKDTSQFHCAGLGKNGPLDLWNGNQHTGGGGRNFLGNIIFRNGIINRLIAMRRPQRRHNNGVNIKSDQGQTESK